MREAHSGQYGHLRWRAPNAPVRIYILMDSARVKSGQGKSKEDIGTNYKKDLSLDGLTQEMILTRAQGWNLTHVADPTNRERLVCCHCCSNSRIGN